MLLPGIRRRLEFGGPSATPDQVGRWSSPNTGRNAQCTSHSSNGQVLSFDTWNCAVDSEYLWTRGNTFDQVLWPQPLLQRHACSARARPLIVGGNTARDGPPTRPFSTRRRTPSRAGRTCPSRGGIRARKWRTDASSSIPAMRSTRAAHWCPTPSEHCGRLVAVGLRPDLEQLDRPAGRPADHAALPVHLHAHRRSADRRRPGHLSRGRSPRGVDVADGCRELVRRRQRCRVRPDKIMKAGGSDPDFANSTHSPRTVCWT